MLDSAGNPRIGYYGNGDLEYARFNGSVWVIETVDSVGTMGYSPSLVLDAAGNPCIS